MTGSRYLVPFLVVGLLQKVDAFAPTGARLMPTAQDQSTRLGVFALEEATTMVDLVMEQPNVAEAGMTACSDVSNLVTLLAESSMDYKRLSTEAPKEVLNSMSHLSMDFSAGFFALGSYFASSSRIINQMCSITGRMLILMADWIPDHSISPQQFVIQLFFLLASFRDEVSSAK